MSRAVHRPQDARRRRALLRVLEGEGRVRRCPRRTLQLTRSEAPPGRVCGACHRTPRDPLLRRPGTAHAGHARAQRPPPRRGPPRSTRLTRGPAVGRCRFGRPSSMRQGRPTARGNASAKISAVSPVAGSLRPPDARRRDAGGGGTPGGRSSAGAGAPSAGRGCVRRRSHWSAGVRHRRAGGGGSARAGPAPPTGSPGRARASASTAGSARGSRFGASVMRR